MPDSRRDPVSTPAVCDVWLPNKSPFREVFVSAVFPDEVWMDCTVWGQTLAKMNREEWADWVDKAHIVRRSEDVL
jgi:hypothetical protein